MYPLFPVSCFQLYLDRHAGVALPVGSLRATQMNKVLLFVIKWLLVVIKLVSILLGPPCVQPQLISAKLITFQCHKWIISKPLLYRCIERCNAAGQSLLQFR